MKSLSGTLAVLFIALKLIGIITWPWIWVLAPVWIPLVVFLAVLGAIAIASMFVTKPIITKYHSLR